MTTDLDKLTADTIAKFHRADLGEAQITAMLADAARLGADTLRDEIRAALVRADAALKERITATDKLARAEERIAKLESFEPNWTTHTSQIRAIEAAEARAEKATAEHKAAESALARIGDAHNAQLHRAMNAEDKVNDLARLQHEVIGAMTDAGEYLPTENPTAPGVVAARIEALARKAKSGFTVSRFVGEQREFSATTFGPGRRTVGIIEHIRKELAEIEAAPTDLAEWIDVVILALDGAWRAGHSAADIEAALWSKLATNRIRTWPDWRTVGEDVAIEHVRTDSAPARRDVLAETIEAIDESKSTAVEAVRKWNKGLATATIASAFDKGTRYAGGEVPMIGDVVAHPWDEGRSSFTVVGLDDDGDPVDVEGINWLAASRTLVRRTEVVDTVGVDGRSHLERIAEAVNDQMAATGVTKDLVAVVRGAMKETGITTENRYALEASVRAQQKRADIAEVLLVETEDRVCKAETENEKAIKVLSAVALRTMEDGTPCFCVVVAGPHHLSCARARAFISGHRKQEP